MAGGAFAGADGEELPGWRRVALAFAVAPAAASLLFGPLAPFALLYGYAATLVLALPAYLLLRGQVRPSGAACTAAGAAAALVPWLTFLVWTAMRTSRGTYAVNGVVQVQDGARTAAGWSSLALGCLHVAAAGALGGLVFWLLVRRRPGTA